MVKFKLNTREVSRPPTLLEQLIEQITAGTMIPCIGPGVDDGLLPNRAVLAEMYADDVQYPFASGRDDLAKIAQFDAATKRDFAVKSGFLDFMASYLWNCAAAGLFSHCDEETLAAIDAELAYLTFSTLAERIGWTDPYEIQEVSVYGLLADLPLPIYITTNYHSFMETALRRANKVPHIRACPWKQDLRPLDGLSSLFRGEDAYEPSAAEPLVFHLYGLDQYPSSLALLENDYSTLLVSAVEAIGNFNDFTDFIPQPVRSAMSGYGLVLLGYQYDGRDFKNLIDSLFLTNPNQRPGSLRPLAIMESRDEQTDNYIKTTLPGFNVCFGTPVQFAYQLKVAWQDRGQA